MSPQPRGAFIVVEGLDRAGKSSQCQILYQALKQQGYQAKNIKFPDRNTPTGKMINSYLRGQAQQDDHSIHLLFSANRWEAAQGIKSDVTNGITVIADRYSYSGAVYSAAKDNEDLSLEWAWWPETGLPRPDLILFLSIASQEAAKRGDYGEERYETGSMQSNVRHLFDLLLSMNHGHRIQIVDATPSMDEVAQKMLIPTLDILRGNNLSTTLAKLRSWDELQKPSHTTS